MKRLLSTIAVFFAFTGALLAEHPNEARGFVADHAYSFHDVDTVNAYNGNMIIRIPIGPQYKVNGSLGYQLSLTYNSHLWHFVDNSDAYHEEIDAVSSADDNAGLGWRLSLGQLYRPNDLDNSDNTGTWMYRSGDGSSHHFWDDLHSSTTADASTQYTRDSSYIRLTEIDAVTRHVEFPDGTVHTFQQLQPGSWEQSTTSGKWYLTSMSDPFGNTASIGYSSTSQYGEVWTITDGARTTSVSFDGIAPYTTVSRVDLKAIGQQALSYTFTYQSLEIARPSGDTGGAGSSTAHPAGSLTVGVLTAITPSAGNAYSMMLGGDAAYDSTTRISAGVLTRLTLPTMGSVGWTYTQIPFGPIEKIRSPAINIPTGVATRTTYDGNGAELATWSYYRFASYPHYCPVYLENCSHNQQECVSGRPRQMTVFITDPATPDGPTKTTINYFSNYEYIMDPDGDSCGPLTEGWLSAEHGLPFTRYKSDSGGRFLSSEVRTGFNFSDQAVIAWQEGDTRGQGQVPPSGSPVKETYVSYRLDPAAQTDAFGFDENASLSSTATYYKDDHDPTGASNCGNAPCFTVTNYGAFDNYGHYKQTSTDGNLPGTGNFRTTFTNYTAAPAPASLWLLTPFSEQCTADEGSLRSVAPAAALTNCNGLPGAFITQSLFDAHGAVTARRTLAKSGGTLDPTDLLSTFTYDAHGSVTGEQYYGGDMQSLDTSSPFVAPPSAAYAITHILAYTGGALTGDKATYSNGVTVSDESYDQATGLVTDVRDVSGLGTHYDYDVLGRVTGLHPPGVAPTTYTYSEASFSGSVFTPAKVFALTDASGAGIGSVRKEYHYDAFGRLYRQKSFLNDDSWSIVQTDYDVLGRKWKVSMPEKLSGSDSSFTPSHQTIFTGYDAYGRAGNVLAPDGKTTTMAFVGIRSVQRTVDIATSASGTSPSMTEEIHDALGRLVSVSELSGGTTSLTSPVGTRVTTTYTYDSADHLTNVSTPPQTRAFSYDHRGFLLQETHPELGQYGNGAIQYVYPLPPATPTVGYDARGHSHLKLTGSLNGSLDLRFVYDPAERLAAVSDFGASLRSLKEYSYWDSSTLSTLGRYKLKQAISHNHPTVLPGEGVITETYTYATPTASGRISKRETLVENVSGSTRTTLQSFTQDFHYDDLGSTSQIDYPVCVSTSSCNGLALTGPSLTHRNGFLVGVSGYASPITYNADGSVFEVTHAGTIKDTYAPDSAGMGRPAMITFNGATSCTAAASVSGGGTINVGQSATIVADLTGTAPWTITWSDGPTQTATQTHWTRTVSPTSTTLYTITSVTDATSCAGTASGSATVTVQTCSVAATVSGGGSIVAGQSATIVADLTGTAPWTIIWSDGPTQTATQAHWTRTVSPTSTTTYTITSVTDATSCAGTASGSATVTVQACSASAAVSGGGSIIAGQSATIAADLSGGAAAPTAGAPWSITWSDGTTQNCPQAHMTRSVTPLVNTTYTVTSVTDSAGCTRSGTGFANVTVGSVPSPAVLIATTMNNTLGVSLIWSDVHITGAVVWYQVERATRINLNDWVPTGGHLSASVYTEGFGSTSNPTTYLYRVRAGVSSGGNDATSTPSPLDYATVATTLFTDEPLAIGMTRNGNIPIRGIHIGELRHAIDAVRWAAGFNTPAWSSYAATTGPVTANDNITARQRLDEAVSILLGHNVAYTGEVPAHNGKIWAYQLQQIRDGVR